MTAAELLGAIATLPPARRLAAAPPIAAAVEVAGIEVATAGDLAEPQFRRAWRERHRGSAPLVLLADGGDSTLVALGPADGDGPLRRISSSDLEALLRRISTLRPLEAVRELAADLERLDQSAIPGLRLRDLLTTHTLDVRLRNDASRWHAAAQIAEGVPPRADWRVLLESVGYEVERRPVRGRLVRYLGRPVAVVHPKPDPSEFARLDSDGRPPEGVLLNDCIAENVVYGILSSGSRLRLFDFSGGAGTTSRYLDLDASSLRPDDRPFLALLAPSFLAEGGFEALVAEAAAFGAVLRKRLDDRIRQAAFPALARGLEAWARPAGLDLEDPAVNEELEKAALTLVFRLLFLLFAESSRYLPMDNRSYEQASITALVREAVDSRERLGARSTSLWDRTQVVIRAMRTGNPAWRVPAYNGALFAGDGFEGAGTLERMSMTDPDFADVLIAVGHDPEAGVGVDYSTLEIGHLGHIYESLLSLRLAPAQRDLVYEARDDRYRPARPGEVAAVVTGSLMWSTNEGGRKSGGVYYTRTELVHHLVQHSVLPAFERHLEQVRSLAGHDAAAAARHLLSFAVVDPACGSAHFLVEVVSVLADRTVRFLAEQPLPEISDAVARLRAGALSGSLIEDAILIQRMVLKHCVYGVDVSTMGAEVAKLSLWLASFVPGLSLAYLDGNFKVGNSLIGVARTESVGNGKYVAADWASSLRAAAAAAARAADIEDRNPDEVEESRRAGNDAAGAARAAEEVFNLWTAEAFGVKGARAEVDAWAGALIAGRRESPLQAAADAAAAQNKFLHWPVAFPRVFDRDRPGFDAIVGNPPWNEVTIEELAFYALFSPGLRGLSDQDRRPAIANLLTERPELKDRLREAQRQATEQRGYLAAGEYSSMAGDPDLYKYFCQRYGRLLREGGELGVVLPRLAFVADGSTGFREWLFERTTTHRLDFLLNRRLWMFDTHAQYTIALLAAQAVSAPKDHKVRVAGVASSPEEWQRQAESPGVPLPRDAYGPGRMVPLVRDEAEADLLGRLRRGNPLPLGPGGRWQCFPVRELDETNDARLWRGATEGVPLWKGGSFDQYAPDGLEARVCPLSQPVLRKIRKPRPGGGSIVAGVASVEARRQGVLTELGRARLAFRDVTNRTNSRTVLACLIPPRVLLVNSAPYLAFVTGGPLEQASCLAIMNSLPFDWQARRFVESHVNFFILEGLRLPPVDEATLEVIARCAARLSCVDARFTDFAAATGVKVSELGDEEEERLRVEIDAWVARAWDLSENDLTVMFRDFTLDAVPATYRSHLLKRLGEI